MVKGVHFVSNFCNLLHPLGLLEHLMFQLWTISANTLTVQLVSTTRQRSGWLSQPGFESRHHLLKTKIRGTSLPLVESFFLIMNYKLFPWCFFPLTVILQGQDTGIQRREWEVGSVCSRLYDSSISNVNFELDVSRIAQVRIFTFSRFS